MSHRDTLAAGKGDRDFGRGDLVRAQERPRGGVLPDRLFVRRTQVGAPEKRQHSRQFGNHLGNHGSIFILSFAVSFA